MQSNSPTQLEKHAVRLNLEEKWEEAINVNLKLLDIQPNDTKAKLRLGRAYLQLKKFKLAKTQFEDVLKLDPINKIALKNLDLTKHKKTQSLTGIGKGISMIKEPGTTKEVKAKSLNDKLTKDISYGTKLNLKINKKSTKILLDKKLIAKIEDASVIKSINSAKTKKLKLSCSFIKQKGNNIQVLIQSKEPIFKGNKQDIKPYMKRGSIEVPKLEIESFDDE